MEWAMSLVATLLWANYRFALVNRIWRFAAVKVLPGP